jgi:tripartite-type tricarboxylate transporter receptor subunit TctC
MIPKARFAAALSCLALLWYCGNAVAQSYPSRPIRVVLPFPPGGASDVTARLLGEKFHATWGANVVADNRPGGIGIIATNIVARAAPDGYTLSMVTLSFAINPSIQKLPYDTLKDFTFITVVASNPLMLVVHPGVPAKTVKELIALARSRPDELKFASSGPGTATHVSAELLKLMTGVRMTHIPYKGSTAAHPDLISGRVDMMFDPVPSIGPHVKSGRVRGLGVTSTRRSAEFPDVPTVAETVPGYESASWVLLLGPAKLPPAIVDKLHAETVRALNLPEIRERLAKMGSEPVGNSPVEARKFVVSELDKWAKTVKAAGITASQ